MIQKLFGTEDDTATAILRLVLGIIFFPHGGQLMLGWFGGLGVSRAMGLFRAHCIFQHRLPFATCVQLQSDRRELHGDLPKRTVKRSLSLGERDELWQMRCARHTEPDIARA